MATLAACDEPPAPPDPPSSPSPSPQTVTVEMVYSTYWGSGPGNLRAAVADSRANVYLAGGTSQADWPTTRGQAHQGGTSDVAVAKFDADGRMLWSRLLGGTGEDYAYVAAVNDAGELYLGGRAGPGFPTTAGAFERNFSGGIGEGVHSPTDAFVAKLTPNGALEWATYIGGSGDENARAIHLLRDGRVIVGGGNATSPDLPTHRGRLPGPVLKPSLGGIRDSWVAVVAADGASIDFITYFGPSDDSNPRGDETIRGLGVDPAGNIWIGGTTQGTMQTTPDAFQRSRGSPPGSGEAYVAKLSHDGRRLVYFSWLGGNGADEIETESVSDPAGNFYVAGSTGSTDFPVSPTAFQTELKGSRGDGAFAEGYVAKIAADGHLAFATFFGGSTEGPEAMFGPVIDAAGNVWATGRFRSWDTPTTAGALQPEKAGPNNSQDAVMVGFDPNGENLRYASFLGGSGTDHGRHLAIHPDGTIVFVVGQTSSTDFPLAAAASEVPSGWFLSAFRVLPTSTSTDAGNLPRALNASREALQVAEGDRDSSVALNEIGKVQVAQGDAQVAQGDLPGALGSYRRSLEIAERLATADPGNAGWQRDLMVSLVKLHDVTNDRDYVVRALNIAERMHSAGILAPRDVWMIEDLRRRAGR